MGGTSPVQAKGLLKWTWAEQRLKKSHNYWLSTVRPDGRPHVMVVWGLWHDSAYYFSTGTQSRKGRNLAVNPRCVISTEDASEAVILEGAARIVKDEALARKILALYKRKYNWDPTTLGQPMYVVQPSAAFGLDENRGPEAATRWSFPA
jgi:nitroimidazol reductase NimA-like FMN-containing flavoprotein (pyridoxamine 5'-phosphate oxidase superfamily)